jgi:hypothetical protein
MSPYGRRETQRCASRMGETAHTVIMHAHRGLGAYVGAVCLLATVGLTADHGSFPSYLTALLLTLPTGVFLPPILFHTGGLISIVVPGADINGPIWLYIPVSVPLFGAAATVNALLAQAALRLRKPCCARVRATLRRA